MIGVAGRSEQAAYEGFITERGVDGFDHIADADGSVWAEFGITSQPAFVFIDDDGTVERRPGAMGVEGLTARVDQLLAG